MFLKLQLLPQQYEPISFKRFATCMTHALLKLRHSVLLVMYNTYNAFATTVQLKGNLMHAGRLHAIHC